MNRFSFLFRLTVATFLSSTSALLAQDQKLQSRATKIHESEQQPSEGVVIGILRDGERIFASAGAKRKEGKTPDAQTLFEIGSITKVFTGVLLADTVREGKAKLSDPVGKFLPEDLLEEDSPLLSSITLKSLATHRSGLERIPGDLFQGENVEGDNPYAHYDTERLYNYLKEVDEDSLETKGEYAYSNLGFGLLGHALERIWEMPYPELIQKRIFEPLGMKSSLVPTDYSNLPKEVQDHLASGHNGGVEVAHWELASFLGAGAMLSSAEDLLRFAEAQWDDETVPADLAAALAEARKQQVDGMGLGWMKKGKVVSHGGGTGGFRTHLSVDLEKKTAEVVLKNSAGEAIEMEATGDFTSISGYWQGTLDTGKQKLRLVRYISPQGRVISFSIDQGCGITGATKTSFDGKVLQASFPTIGGRYEGELKGENEFKGTWTQGGDLPLTLKRTQGMPESLQKGLKKKYPDDLAPLEGYWSGYLGGKEGLFVYVQIEKFHESFFAQLYSPDQTPAPIGVTRLRITEDRVNLVCQMIQGKFNGKLNRETKTAKGKWNQGGFDQPLELKWTAHKPERE